MTLIAYLFPKLQTAKDVVGQISKKARFRTPFDSQHVKGSQTLVKSAWEHFHDISSSLWVKLISNISLLVIWDILGVFVKIWIADGKYPFRNC